MARRLDNSEFVAKAKIVHGDLYLYNKVAYTNINNKIVITCRKHGDFLQRPDNHLKGMGCRACAIRAITKTFDKFVIDARLIHGDKYDYNNVDYINNRTKIIITCPIHGDFVQKPDNHLDGKGCPSCAERGYSPLEKGTFYVYDGDFVGFGITNDFRERHTTHVSNFDKHSVVMVLYKTYESDGFTIQNLESCVKQRFSEHIINTGISGFKTEAVRSEVLDTLIGFVEYSLGLDPERGFRD